MQNTLDHFSLIQTKLYRPPLSPDYIPRPQLLERLDSIHARPLTLVSAPTGYGKTTLLSAWVQRCGCRAAWLSLDEHDNRPAIFLAYFLAALKSLFPSVGTATLALLDAPALPPLPVLATSLLQEIDSLQQEFTLLLDLLRHPVPFMHLVLVTRFDPPLPLSRLRVSNQLAELRVPDFRFSPGE